MNNMKGRVTGVNGNMVNVEFEGSISKNEVGYIHVGKTRLKSEVIRINSNVASLQVFESTTDVAVGDSVEFTSEMLSVELGPGLLKQIYDGLQNPLPELASQCGFFLQRGVYLDPIPNLDWEFTPTVKVGDKVLAGDTIGTVPEGLFTHQIMVPFNMVRGQWKVQKIVKKGTYNVRDIVATLENQDGITKDLSMVFSWPVKVPIKCYDERLSPDEPLVMKVRIIDTFLPVAKGGTFCVPGPFGAGKTVLQHMESRNADVDVVIIAACGERAGEVVEVLKEFPELIDPKTNKSLMERTIIICNTSSMPVAAREASVYTAVTMAEYYRQMGLNVLLLADSTSRWAQAMREMSGRLEEIPGEEAFPAYLETRIAEFYERAGKVRLKDGRTASVTIGGTVSPAGGNFEEPVTQATLKVVGAFHGLSRERSDARKYPAINSLESWSKYTGVIENTKVEYARAILFRGNEVNQMMKVVGEEGTSINDYITYQKSELLDAVYLQQNSFDPVDSSVLVERQQYTFNLLFKVLGANFDLKDKKAVRSFFNKMRQKFLDWNNVEFKSQRFEQIEGEIKTQFDTSFVSFDEKAEKLM
ncbi:MAG: V-type ATP synthase subunit A [Spirochaetia bacterium]|nr:V-type ATP synthase subunit A [Spirochaetia bacterium]